MTRSARRSREAGACALSPEIVLEKVPAARARRAVVATRGALENSSASVGGVLLLVACVKGAATESAASGLAKLGDCIVAEVARWRFPAEDGEQSFALPLDLIAN